MIFTEITLDELKEYQENNKHRFFFQQNNIYKQLTDNNNVKTKIFAVKENNKIIAYSIFNFFRYKKLFYKAVSYYGPIMDYSNKELVKFYFLQLKNYLRKDLRTISLIVNPFLNKYIFEDTNNIYETDISKDVHNIILNIGFKNLEKDFFDLSYLASYCVYSKNLKDITKENLLKNISSKARSSINKTKNDNIKIRDLDLSEKEDFDIFYKLNKMTSNRLEVNLHSTDYFAKLQKYIKSKVHIKLAYIEYSKFINDNKEKLDNLYKEKENLISLLDDPNINQKRTQSKIYEIEKNIISIENKIEKINKVDKDKENINLSCAVFIESGEDLIYFLGMTNKDLNSFEGPYAIQNFMINYAIENNFKYYNFYATSSDFSKKSVDYNILQFKRSFNGNIEWFMDNYELKSFIGKFFK